MADTRGQAEIKTKYPVTDGIVARTTSQTGHQMNLLPSEGSMVPQRNKKGMTD